MGKGILAHPRQRQCDHCHREYTQRSVSTLFCSDACRFWSKVDRREARECWPWLGPVDRDGYGLFDTSVELRANRAAFRFSKGDIPQGLLICHSCDNPICCNPAHLWLGTPKANTVDSVVKRRRVGARTGKVKLTDSAVAVIRGRLSAGELPRDLAIEFGVESSTIDRIKAGRSWPHITHNRPLVLSDEATRRMKKRILDLQIAGIRKAAARRRMP